MQNENHVSEEAQKLFDRMVAFLTSAEGTTWAKEELPQAWENHQRFLERIGRLPEQCGECKRFTGRRKKFESAMVGGKQKEKATQENISPTED